MKIHVDDGKSHHAPSQPVSPSRVHDVARTPIPEAFGNSSVGHTMSRQRTSGNGLKRSASKNASFDELKLAKDQRNTSRNCDIQASAHIPTFPGKIPGGAGKLLLAVHIVQQTMKFLSGVARREL